MSTSAVISHHAPCALPIGAVRPSQPSLIVEGDPRTVDLATARAARAVYRAQPCYYQRRTVCFQVRETDGGHIVTLDTCRPSADSRPEVLSALPGILQGREDAERMADHYASRFLAVEHEEALSNPPHHSRLPFGKL